MRSAGAFVLLSVVAALEALAFAGVRLALRADENRRRGHAIAVLYWLVSAAVLGAAIWHLALGPRDSDNDARIPGTVIVAVAAVYIPKIWLAALTLAELVRSLAACVLRRAVTRPAGGRTGQMTRARLLPQVGLALAGVTFGGIVWESTLGRSDVGVYRHTVVCRTLPAEFDGLRIVQLSDVHAASLGPSSTRLADRLVTVANAERPDVVVYTGDYGEAADLKGGPDIFGRLHARFGKFAVLGNHDFGGRERAADNWRSAEDKRRKIETLAQTFRSRGFTLLLNDAAVLSKGSGRIAILGVGVYDPHHGFYDADVPAAERAAGGAVFRLLIAHSPQYWESVVQGRRDIELTLVGHTHGAQIGFGIGSLVWSPAAIVYRHWGGLYREGWQYLNVNRGTGYTGLPLRLNMPAEVSVIVVRSRNRGQ